MNNIAKSFPAIELFHHANPSSIAHLASVGVLKKYPKGSHLFYDKDPVNTVYFLVEGCVSLYKLNSNGEKKVIFTLNAGKAINDEILNELPTSNSCETLCECSVMGFPIKDFLTVMETDAPLTRAVIGSLSLKVRRLYRQLKNTPASIRGDKKLAAKLWKLSLDMGKPSRGGIEIDIDMTITYLAEMLGIKRENVSRQLKILKEKDLVRHENGHFIIPDRNKLQEYFKSL